MKYLKDIKDWKECVNEVVCSDCLEALKQMPDESIDMVMTSPPYWALRCYLPDEVKLKDTLSKEEKAYVEKELTLLGIKSKIRI